MNLYTSKQKNKMIPSSNKPFKPIPSRNKLFELIFCMKCKKKTKTNDITYSNTKNNRRTVKRIKYQCKIIKNVTVGSEIKSLSKKVNDLKEIYYDKKTGFCRINELVKTSKKRQKK